MPTSSLLTKIYFILRKVFNKNGMSQLALFTKGVVKRMDDLIDKIKNVFRPQDTMLKGNFNPFRITIGVPSTPFAASPIYTFNETLSKNYVPLTITLFEQGKDADIVSYAIESDQGPTGWPTGGTLDIEYLKTQPSDWNELNPVEWNGEGWYLALTAPSTITPQTAITLQVWVSGVNKSGEQVGAYPIGTTFYPVYCPSYKGVSLPAATVGEEYNATISPANITTLTKDNKMALTVKVGTVPSWLSVTPSSKNNYELILKGTPTESGPVTVPVTFSNSSGNCGKFSMAVAVQPQKFTFTISGNSIDNSGWSSGQFFNYEPSTSVNYFPLAFTGISDQDIESVTGTVSGLTDGSSVTGQYLTEQPDWPYYNPFSWNGAGWYLILTVPNTSELTSNQLQNSSTFTLTATAKSKSGGTATYSMTNPQVEVAPVFSTTTLPDATVGEKYTYTVTCTNSADCQLDGQDGNYLVFMSLPAWLNSSSNPSSADPNGNYSLIFNGTPTEEGNNTITVQNQNENGQQCGNYTFTVKVNPAPAAKTTPSDSDKTSTSGDKTTTDTPKNEHAASPTDSSGGESQTTPSKTESSTPAPAPKPVVNVTPHVNLSLPTEGWAYGINNILVGGVGTGYANPIYIPLSATFTDAEDNTTSVENGSYNFTIVKVTGLSAGSEASVSTMMEGDWGIENQNPTPSPLNAYGPPVNTTTTASYLILNLGEIVNYFEDQNTDLEQPSFVKGVRTIDVTLSMEYTSYNSAGEPSTYTTTSDFSFNLFFLVAGFIGTEIILNNWTGNTAWTPALPPVQTGQKLSCSIPVYSDSTSITVSDITGADWVDIKYDNGELVFSGTAPSTSMSTPTLISFTLSDGTHSYNQSLYLYVNSNISGVANPIGYNGGTAFGSLSIGVNENWLNAQGGTVDIALYGDTQNVYIPLSDIPSNYSSLSLSAVTVTGGSLKGVNFPEGSTVTLQQLTKQPADYNPSTTNPWVGAGWYIVCNLTNASTYWNGSTLSGYGGAESAVYIYCSYSSSSTEWYASTLTRSIGFNWFPEFQITSPLPSAEVGKEFNLSFTPSNVSIAGKAAGDWYLNGTPTGLPAGLSASTSGSGSTMALTVSGTPTAAGKFNVSIPVSSSTGGYNGTNGDSSQTTLPVTFPLTVAPKPTNTNYTYSLSVGLPSTGWKYGTNNVLLIGEVDCATVSLPIQFTLNNETLKTSTNVASATNGTAKVTGVTGLSSNSYVAVLDPTSFYPISIGGANPLPEDKDSLYLVIDIYNVQEYLADFLSTGQVSFVNGVKQISVDLEATYNDPVNGKSYTAQATVTLNLLLLQCGYGGYTKEGSFESTAGDAGVPTLPPVNTGADVSIKVPYSGLTTPPTVSAGSGFPSGWSVSYSDNNIVFSGTSSSTSMTAPSTLEVDVKDGDVSYSIPFVYLVDKFTSTGTEGTTSQYTVADGISQELNLLNGSLSIFIESQFKETNGNALLNYGNEDNLYLPLTLTVQPENINISTALDPALGPYLTGFGLPSGMTCKLEYLTSKPADYPQDSLRPWVGEGYYLVFGNATSMKDTAVIVPVTFDGTYVYTSPGNGYTSAYINTSVSQKYFIMKPPAFDFGSLPVATVGEKYDQTVPNSTGNTFSIVSSSEVPPGLTLSSKGSGLTISGTPTKEGNYTISSELNCQGGQGTANYMTSIPLTVQSAPVSKPETPPTPSTDSKPASSDSGSTKESTPSPSDTTSGNTESSPSDSGSKEDNSSTPDKTTGSPASTTGSGQGDTKTQSSGNTPVKSDTPSTSNNSTPTKTASSTPSSTNGNSPPTESKPSTPTPTVSPLKFSYPNSSTTVSTTGSVSFTPTVSGGESVKDYEVVGTLPEGLTLNTTTGVLSGSITVPGTYSVKVECVSGAQNASSTVSITVVNPLSLSYGSITGVTGNSVSLTPTVSGGSGTTTFSVSGVSPSSVAGAPIPLPGITGLFLNPLTGEISGTPLSAVSTAVKIIGSDSVGQATAIVNIDVEKPITMTGTLAEQSLNKAFSFTPTISGGTPSKYVFSYTCENGLPEGVTFNATTCSLSGVCSTAVSGCSITLTCTDGISTAHLTVTLNVSPPLAIIPDQTAVFSDGVSGKYVLQGSNLGENPVWAITNGSLPSGLNLVNGAIIGETTAVGSYTLTLAVKAPINTASGILTLNVVEDLNISPPLPTGTVGLPYSFTPEVSGGNAKDYYFSLSVLNNKSLMSGLVFSNTNGSITGVPTSAGSIQVVITVTDGQSTKSTATLSLTINSVVTTPSGSNNETMFTQLLQKYVTLLTSPTVTSETRSKAIQCISQATNLLVSTPTSTMFETMYQYQVQYQATLFVDTNFFLGNSVLTSQDQSKLSGVYNAFRMLVTSPTLGISWDYIAEPPLNCVPLLNWLQNKQKTIQQLQTQK